MILLVRKELLNEADEFFNQYRLPYNFDSVILENMITLKTQRGTNVPPNAVLLSENEALAHQKAVVRDWPSETEVVTLRYGHHLAAATTGVSASLIVSYIKRALFIKKHSIYFATFIPSILIPSSFSYYLTEKYLTHNTLLMKLNCPVCHQIKFGAIQYATGIIYPALLGYLSFSMYATLPGLKTYNIPDITIYPKEYWQETFKIFKRGSKTFQTVGILNTALIFLLPYLQSQQLSNILKKLSEKNSLAEFSEEEFKNNLDETAL